MVDLLKYISLWKEGYSQAVNPVCEKYGLTSAEFDVLMFLANNPEFDTATDIVEKRYLAKSHVSTSITSLEKKQYLTRTYHGNNRRTIHLIICEAAKEIILDGRKAQQFFYEITMQSFSTQERENIQKNFQAMMQNIEQYINV